MKTNLYLNNISQITFNVSKYLNDIKTRYWDLIDYSRLIELVGIGWFQISAIQQIGNGINESLSVTALSLENEFCTKKLTSFGKMGTKDDWDGGLDRYCLCNFADIDHSILHIVVKKVPSWKVGYVDPKINTGYRAFTDDEVDAYSFLTQTVSETFECIFIFDTFNQTINAYSFETLGKLTSIYLSYHNVVKEIKIDSNLSNIKTVMTVTGGTYGSSNLGIIEVNPSGSNMISNFSYFKPLMTKELQNKLTEYEFAYKENEKTFKTNVAKLQALYKELNQLVNALTTIDITFFDNRLKELEKQIKETSDTSEKAKLQEEYNKVLAEKTNYLKDQENYIYTHWEDYGSVALQELFDSYSEVLSTYIGSVNSDIHAKEVYDKYYKLLYGTYSGDPNCVDSELKKRNQQIENKKTEIESQKELCQTSVLNLEKFLGEKLYKELTHYVHEDSFVDDTFLATDAMTDEEILEMQQELFKQAEKELAKVCQPQYTTTVTNINFLNIPTFKNFSDELYLGDLMTLEFDYGVTVEARLLKISIDWDKLDNFELVFSSKTSLDEGILQLNEIRQQAQSSSTTLNLHGLGWNYATNKTSEVHEFINSSLNASLNKLMNSTNQEVLFDNTGLRCRKYDSDRNGYDPRQIWLTSNQIAFSADGFRNVSMALGEIEINGNNVYGLVADAIVGKLVATENLLITNGKGNVTIDGEKAKFENCEIAVTNGTNTIRLDPSGVLEVKKGATKQLYFENGNLTITGTMKSGKIESSDFYAGSISIGGTSENPTFSVDSTGHVIANSIKLGSGSVTNDTLASDVSNKIQGAYDGVAENAQDLLNTLNALSSTGIVTINNGTITAGKIYASMIAAGTLAGFNIISYGTNGKNVSIQDGVLSIISSTNCITNFRDGSIDLTYIDPISKVQYTTVISTNDIIVSSTYHTTYIKPHEINTPSIICNDIKTPSGITYCLSGHVHETPEIRVGQSSGGYDKGGIWIGSIPFLGAQAAGVDYVGRVSELANTALQTAIASSTSDFRLKRDFKRTKNIKNIYMGLKPYDYRFKTKSDFYNQKIHSGLLAQQVINLFNKNNINWEDYDLIDTFTPPSSSDEGQYVGKEAYKINYNNLHAWHIYMIQELWKKVEVLEKETEWYKHIVQSMSCN